MARAPIRSTGWLPENEYYPIFSGPFDDFFCSFRPTVCRRGVLKAIGRLGGPAQVRRIMIEFQESPRGETGLTDKSEPWINSPVYRGAITRSLLDSLTDRTPVTGHLWITWEE
jgi:hypothetical protein